MKRCERCKVSVNTPLERCPLCYALLVQEDSEPEIPSYPNLLVQAETYNILYRILLFLSLTTTVVCLIVNWLTFEQYWWSLIVVANILYMWIAIGTAIRRFARIGYNIMVQAISLAGLLVVIDFFSGHQNWALNFVLPFLFISATLSITIIIIVKRMAVSRFVLYFILTALLGFIPIVLLAVGVVTVAWPSLVSAIYSGLSLVSLFIFADNATKIELKKRFHI